MNHHYSSCASSMSQSAQPSASSPLNGAGDEGRWFQGMSWSTRIQGCVIFTALGLFSSFMGWLAIGMGSTWKYSVLATLGQLMSLLSTLFLMGPQRQCEMMFDLERRAATLLYLGSMIFTIAVAVWTQSTVLCVLCGVVEYGALFWYSLSYIPYGREVAANAAKGISRMVINV